MALHPYLIGQPHRVKYLDEILPHVMSTDGVWQTTADVIAEYYIAHYYDQAIAHAASSTCRARGDTPMPAERRLAWITSTTIGPYGQRGTLHWPDKGALCA